MYMKIYFKKIIYENVMSRTYNLGIFSEKHVTLYGEITLMLIARRFSLEEL